MLARYNETPDRNVWKLGTVVVLNTVSKPINFWFKHRGSRAHGPLACVFLDCRQTHNEEPLPLPVFIYADDVVRQRGFATLQSALSFSLLIL